MRIEGIVKKGFGNIIYVVIAQTISFLLGISRAMILPITLGITNFGYWQVYLLYVSYVGIFSLGFNDGIYLRYGKYNFNDLPKPLFRTSIKTFVVIQFVITFICSIIILLESDPSKKIAISLAILNIPIAGLSGVLFYIFQITNQLKKYSFYSVIDKVIVLVAIFLILILRLDQFIIVIVVDIISKLIVLMMMIYSCKDLIFGKGTDLISAFKEFGINIQVGIQLMLANLAGMLVLGFGRFLVERFESVEIYGGYSFAISTLNLVLVFVSAVGVVMYPTLNRLNEGKYPLYFKFLNKGISIVAFGTLFIYFPLYILISNYMKSYLVIFEYLPVIFGIVYIQMKMQILVNPFYKLLRKESAMLRANIIGLLIAVIMITPAYFFAKSVTAVAIGTFLAMAIRLYLSEFYLQEIFTFKKYRKNVMMEIIMLGFFILVAYQENKMLGFGLYIVAFIFYLFINRHFLIELSKKVRLLTKKR